MDGLYNFIVFISTANPLEIWFTVRALVSFMLEYVKRLGFLKRGKYFCGFSEISTVAMKVA